MPVHRSGWRYFPWPFPKDQSAVGQVVASPHLVITLVQSGLKMRACVSSAQTCSHGEPYRCDMAERRGWLLTGCLTAVNVLPEKVICMGAELDCELEKRSIGH